MEYRRLGNSDLEVSAFAFGAWQIGDPTYWGADAEKDAKTAVDAALDAGITFFDTAELYGAGESERVLGRLLKGRREKALVASKVKCENCAPQDLVAACEASLSRLGMDYLDLYQVHWPPRDVAFADVYDAMARLRDQGKIRAIGVSNFGPIDLDTWFETGECVSNQVGYNLGFRAVEYAIAPACARHGVGLLTYTPLMQGTLTCRWKSIEEIPEIRRRTRQFSSARTLTRHGESGQETALMKMLEQLEALALETGHSPASLALAWLAAQPGVSSVIIGARDAAQLRRNLLATEVKMDGPLLARMGALSGALKAALGPNADMWLSTAESRIR